MRNINPFGLRLQPHLRSRLEAAAEANKRSLNAEISARLEESFHKEAPALTELISARKAHRIAISARQDLAAHARKEVIQRLNEAIRQGVTEFKVDLERFAPAGPQSSAFERVANSIGRELADAGYLLEWCDNSSLRITIPDFTPGFPESLRRP